MDEDEHHSVHHHQPDKMEKLLVLALCLTFAFALPLNEGERVKRGYESSEEEEDDSHSLLDFSGFHHGYSLGGDGGLSLGSHHEPQFHESVHVEPVHKTLKVPVPHPVKQPFQIPVPVRVLEPYPIKIPVPVQVEKIVQVPVEKIVEYPVEKLVPVKVVKKVRVPVPKPYPVPVPVYKTKYVYHTKKYYHDSHHD